MRREALIVFVFSVLNALVGFGGNRLLTEIVSPAELGELYLLNNLATWLTVPTASGFIYLTHHWSIAKEQGLLRLLLRGLVVGLSAQALLAVIGAVVLHLIDEHLVRMSITLGLIAMCIGTAAGQAYGPIPAAERWRVAAGWLGLFFGARQLALAVGVVLFSVGTVGGLLWVQSGHLLVSAAATILVVWLILRGLPARAPTSASSKEISWRAFVHYSLPALLASVVTQIASSAERWGLAGLEDTKATALFVQAVGIATAGVGSVSGVITSYFYPLVTQAAARGDDPIGAAAVPLRRFFLTTFTLMVLACAGGVVLAPIATPILFGKRFAGVEPLLPWAICGAAVFSLSQMLTIVLFTGREPIGPNVARTASQVAYAAALLLIHPRTNAALAYSRLYMGGQGLFLLFVLVALALLVHNRRSRGDRESALTRRGS